MSQGGFILRQKNIKNEISFLNLFGYQVLGPISSDKWLILDEDGKDIGYIQKKLLDDEKDTSEIGYETKIESATICCNAIRKENSNNSKYWFDVKKEGRKIAKVFISLGLQSSLQIWTKKHDYLGFRIECNRLQLYHKGDTKKFAVTEYITSEFSDIIKYYEYCIQFHRKTPIFPNNRTKQITIVRPDMG